jgi:thioredoxin-like negative regulator of GroEL
MPRLVSGPPDAQWTVVALCAEWCGTCRDYFAAFAQLAKREGEVRHLWIDIEDDSDWLGDVEVETLPSLLVLRDAQPLFFGPVLPHIEVLERTLRALMQHAPASSANADAATSQHIVAHLLRAGHLSARRAPQ